jgi:hypothetical protein
MIQWEEINAEDKLKGYDAVENKRNSTGADTCSFDRIDVNCGFGG